MSELKSQIALLQGLSYVEYREVYLKSEADKVIAELEKKLDLYKRGWEESDKNNAYLYAQIRRHKFKRCLAMARWCRTSARYDEGIGAFKYRDWYWKWFKRWLELAEKFKEVK